MGQIRLLKSFHCRSRRLRPPGNIVINRHTIIAVTQSVVIIIPSGTLLPRNNNLTIGNCQWFKSIIDFGPLGRCFAFDYYLELAQCRLLINLFDLIRVRVFISTTKQHHHHPPPPGSTIEPVDRTANRHANCTTVIILSGTDRNRVDRRRHPPSSSNPYRLTSDGHDRSTARRRSRRDRTCTTPCCPTDHSTYRVVIIPRRSPDTTIIHRVTASTVSPATVTGRRWLSTVMLSIDRAVDRRDDRS